MLKKIVSSHLILHWGVPAEIYVRQSAKDRELAIMEFFPKGVRNTYRYAMNGMSTFLQGEDGNQHRIEIFAATQHRSPWVIELLEALAGYPTRYLTSFNPFDILSIGQPIDRKGSPYEAIMIAPPSLDESPSMGATSMKGLSSEPILFHQIIGVHNSETDLSLRTGNRELWDRLQSLENYMFLDAARPKII